MGEAKNKILVVDDSPTICKNLKHALEDASFEVFVAEDGNQGLAAFVKHKDLDLIITDIHMPKMDGIEMIEKIVEMGFKKPIMVLTQERRKEFVNKAKEAGAIGWMVKPFHPKDVIEAVNQALANSAS